MRRSSFLQEIRSHPRLSGGPMFSAQDLSVDMQSSAQPHRRVHLPRAQTGSPSEGTVPLQSQFPPAVTLPYDDTAGFVMGVALANMSAAFASVTVTMWDDSGN